MNGFALGLGLKRRLRATRKWAVAVLKRRLIQYDKNIGVACSGGVVIVIRLLLGLDTYIRIFFEIFRRSWDI